MALPVGFEKRSDAVRRASWGREYLDFYEQSEIKSLVTRDRIRLLDRPCNGRILPGKPYIDTHISVCHCTNKFVPTCSQQP